MARPGGRERAAARPPGIRPPRRSAPAGLRARAGRSPPARPDGHAGRERAHEPVVGRFADLESQLEELHQDLRDLAIRSSRDRSYSSRCRMQSVGSSQPWVAGRDRDVDRRRGHLRRPQRFTADRAPACPARSAEQHQPAQRQRSSFGDDARRRHRGRLHGGSGRGSRLRPRESVVPAAEGRSGIGLAVCASGSGCSAAASSSRAEPGGPTIVRATLPRWSLPPQPTAEPAPSRTTRVGGVNCPDDRRLVTGRTTMLRSMPSWSPSESPPEEQAARSTAATAIERARRLREQLLAGDSATPNSPVPSVTGLNARPHYPFRLRDLPDRVLYPASPPIDTRCTHPMKLLMSHPELALRLVYALNETDCLAARTTPRHRRGVRTVAPDGGKPAHAAAELLFFVKAWGRATRSSGQCCSSPLLAASRRSAASAHTFMSQIDARNAKVRTGTTEPTTTTIARNGAAPMPCRAR